MWCCPRSSATRRASLNTPLVSPLQYHDVDDERSYAAAADVCDDARPPSREALDADADVATPLRFAADPLSGEVDVAVRRGSISGLHKSASSPSLSSLMPAAKPRRRKPLQPLCNGDGGGDGDGDGSRHRRRRRKRHSDHGPADACGAGGACDAVRVSRAVVPPCVCAGLDVRLVDASACHLGAALAAGSYGRVYECHLDGALPYSGRRRSSLSAAGD
jgi:hypothetical protein